MAEVVSRAWVRESWSERAERALAPALPRDGDAEIVGREVAAGTAALWRCGESWMVLRREADELVVVCFVGRDLRRASAEIIAAARAAPGVRWVRWHSQHLGIARMLRHLNPEPVEYVHRVAVTHGK